MKAALVMWRHFSVIGTTVFTAKKATRNFSMVSMLVARPTVIEGPTSAADLHTHKKVNQMKKIEITSISSK